MVADEDDTAMYIAQQNKAFHDFQGCHEEGCVEEGAARKARSIPGVRLQPVACRQQQQTIQSTDPCHRPSKFPTAHMHTHITILLQPSVKFTEVK